MRLVPYNMGDLAYQRFGLSETEFRITHVAFPENREEHNALYRFRNSLRWWLTDNFPRQSLFDPDDALIVYFKSAEVATRFCQYCKTYR